MWDLVNASYGIAMGQRPAGARHTEQKRAPESGDPLSIRSPRMRSISALCVPLVLRVVATMTAGVDRHRAFGDS